MVSVLYVNPKWKKSEVYDSISKFQFQVQYDEEINPLDFKTNASGFCYIPKKESTELTKQKDLSEYRKKLVKVHNKFPNLTIQALIDYSDKDLFNKIQIFATIELKIQVIPIDSANEVAQFLDRLMVTEQKQDNNPFLKELNLVKPNDSLINCIRMIPKIGDKNAKTLATVFQNLKSLSNATFDELKDVIGANCAKSVVDFLQSTE